MKRVCHLTSAHTQEDIRIFHKECVSLAGAGYDVYQISCGKTYDKKGVHIVGIGLKPTGRFTRMRKTASEIYKAALKIDADVYHLHDPELLPYGLKLKRLGKKVLFDSHEDVPEQIMDKDYIAGPLRKIVSVGYRSYESHVIKQLDAVVAATPHIAEKFKGRCRKVVTVNNYPLLDDIKFHEKSFTEREPIICYAGGISEMRGEKIMVEALRHVAGKLIMAGDHEIESPYPNIQYVGRLNRDGVNELYGSARLGLCILKPIKNYYYSQPIKIFEYMAAGLPVVASNFPLWRKIVEDNACGVCVDPADINAVRKACEELLNNPEKGQQLGRNGRKAVFEKYNWANEEKTLLALYDSL